MTFFKVKILLTDPDVKLRPGMSARAEVRVAVHEQALVVPVESVVYRRPLGPDGKPLKEGAAGADEEVKVVFVIEKDKAVQRPVTLGIADATHVEVTAGVKPGEVVINGPHRVLKDLKNGDAVQVSKKGKETTSTKKKGDEDEDKSKDKD